MSSKRFERSVPSSTGARGRFARASLLAVTVAAGVACRDRKSAGGTGSGAIEAETTAIKSGSCQRPLAEYCRNEPCPTYEREVAELRKLIAAYKDSGSCLQRAKLGTCAGHRFVMTGDGYSGHITYYDARGLLVAAERSSDTNSYCGGKAHTAYFGPVPADAQVVSEDLCAGEWRLNGF